MLHVDYGDSCVPADMTQTTDFKLHSPNYFCKRLEIGSTQSFAELLSLHAKDKVPRQLSHDAVNNITLYVILLFPVMCRLVRNLHKHCFSLCKGHLMFKQL